MNERLNMQDLVEQLAAKHGMNKKEADGFVKEFFLLIEQALESDRCVKIKGFGTFKLVDVDSRESVNVNTGERFEIQGHTKISFTPDTALRNTINKPFEHFETVILNENTVLEDTLEEDSEDESIELIETPEVEVERIIAVNEPASVVDEPTVAVVIEEPLKEEAVVPAEESPKDEVAPIAEENTVLELSDTKTEEPAFVESKQVADAISQPLAEDIIAAELRKADREFRGAAITPEKIVDQSGQPPKIPVPDKPTKEKTATPYLITIIILVLLLCGSALLFVYYPDLFSSINQQEVVQTPIPQSDMKQEILPDTFAAVKDTVAEAAPQKEVVPEEIKRESSDQIKITVKTAGKTAVPVKPDSVTYRITGTKMTYIVKEGETLTRISLRFYGTKDLWPYIVQYNRDIIKNPDNVPYGTTLRIPELVKK